jgi:hypothetical protein
MPGGIGNKFESGEIKTKALNKGLGVKAPKFD